MLRRCKNKLFKHQLLATALFMFGFVLLSFGGSFAFFQSTSTANEYNSIKVGNLELSYVDTGAGYGDVLSLNGAYPISDEDGRETTPYRFNITNTGSLLANFKIKILNDEAIIGTDCCENIEIDSEDCQKKLLQPQYIKYQLDNEEPVLLSSKQAVNYVIYEVQNMVPGSSEIHELRIWITENASNEVLGKHYHGKLVLETIQGGTDNSLASTVLLNNSVVNINPDDHKDPDLTTTSDADEENNKLEERGLYVSYNTNSGKPTYYFRGAVDNNWVRFADMDWRIVRINEDGTIRLILQDGINNNYNYDFSSGDGEYTYMYYKNSNAESILNSWYTDNIENTSYATKVATGNYYCEQARVVNNQGWENVSDETMVLYSDYQSDFKCKEDKNHYGIVGSNIGLITYDEVVYAGGSVVKNNFNYYLNNGNVNWTMSPAGFSGSYIAVWRITNTGSLYRGGHGITNTVLRPVINLNADTEILSGNGTENNKYIIKTVTE